VKNILFRADSSASIGLGHIKRDIALASKIRDANIFFACQDMEGNIIHEIPYPVLMVESLETDELIAIIKQYAIDTLIIDHYAIGYREEQKIKAWTNVQCIVFDDNYHKHECDMVINQSIHAQKEKYHNKIGLHTRLLCGGQYILLDDLFYVLDTVQKREEYILITLGGGEIREKIIELIHAVKPLTTLPLIVVAPQLSPKDFFYDQQVEVRSYTPKMGELIAHAALVISSLGMTAYEAMFLKKKLLPVRTADNQRDLAMFFEQNNVPFCDLHICNQKTLQKFFMMILNTDRLTYSSEWVSPERDWINRFL
jgi:UDP-2,4-diacetamido-2,4,6-trideoxy-beta-L-altropyranose hydrolase